MTQLGHLHHEVKRMVEQGDIETSVAVRLLLASQAQLLAEMEELKKDISQLQHYPLLTWPWWGVPRPPFSVTSTSDGTQFEIN